MYDYCEFSTCLPFEELFYEKWEDNLSDMVVDNTIYDLTKLLNIFIDRKILENGHQGRDKRIDVFHAKGNQEVFAYFDHFKEPTDQNDMIYFAVRLPRANESKVFELFYRLYTKSSPRCNFQIDCWNQSNYHRVFKSEFCIKTQPEFADKQLFRHVLEL